MGLPSEEAVTIALRTQQIIAEESGVAKTGDPMGGSYYLESLTQEIKARAMEELERIQKLGGALEAIKSGYIQKEIQKSAYAFQKDVDEGMKIIVGVNRFSTSEKETTKVEQIPRKSIQLQLRHLKNYRKTRNKSLFEKTIFALEDEASRDPENRKNLIPFIIEVTMKGATTGEISDALRSAFGEYRPRTAV